MKPGRFLEKKHRSVKEDLTFLKKYVYYFNEMLVVNGLDDPAEPSLSPVKRVRCTTGNEIHRLNFL